MKNILLLKELLISPRSFFLKTQDVKLGKMPFFPLAVIVFGLFHGIDRLDTTYIKHSLRPGFQDSPFFDLSWLGYWGIACIAGLIGGYIIYAIGSWFYNIRIKWSGGIDSPTLSKKIYIYSSFFLGIITIIITVFDTFLYATPTHIYTSETIQSSIIEFPLMLLVFLALFHSIYVSYKGVTIVENIKKIRAIVWFLVLPLLIYSFVIIALFMAMIGLLGE